MSWFYGAVTMFTIAFVVFTVCAMYAGYKKAHKEWDSLDAELFRDKVSELCSWPFLVGVLLLVISIVVTIGRFMA